jgi:tetratricopeptide (TPR) repeat protein
MVAKSLRVKSFEELEVLEQKLLDEEEKTGQENYAAKIDLYKKMYSWLRKLVRDDSDVYDNYFENVRQLLVHQLVHYGTYLKTEYQKDDHLAAICLKDALKFDNQNPIAAYRLGFLAYKREQYSEALSYFEKALDSQRFYQKHPYQLNQQQQLNAHLYLTNSALYIAKETAEKMSKLRVTNHLELPNSELNPLYHQLFENENYLERHAYYNTTKNGKTTCSKRECEELIELPPKKTIILYFNDRTILAVFENKEVELSAGQGDMLKHFMLKSTEEKPATRAAFSIVHNIKPNTYIQNATRLRNKLSEHGFPPIIHTKRYQNETAYYVDESMSYNVMYRVDDEIE